MGWDVYGATPDGELAHVSVCRRWKSGRLRPSIILSHEIFSGPCSFLLESSVYFPELEARMITHKTLRLALALILLTSFLPMTACFESEVEKIDKAIAELQKANRTFEDLKNILEGLKNNLDNGVYKDQVDDLIGRTGQVAQLSVEGSVDFVRARLIEDLDKM